MAKTNAEGITRRQVLQGGGALAASCILGCSAGTVTGGNGDSAVGGDSGGAGDSGGGDPGGDPVLGDARGDPAAGDADGGDATNAAPVWQTIPDQTWVVGVPVMLDLADYCTDPEGDPLTFELDQTLPTGVTLNGSVISGTPTAAAASADYVATADDGV